VVRVIARFEKDGNIANLLKVKKNCGISASEHMEQNMANNENCELTNLLSFSFE
jgi:hypothetical protein